PECPESTLSTPHKASTFSWSTRLRGHRRLHERIARGHGRVSARTGLFRLSQEGRHCATQRRPFRAWPIRSRFSVARRHVRGKTIPDGRIFRFGGVWPGLETRFFKLELLGENAAFTFPVSDILRIEPTLHKIPRGKSADVGKARIQPPLSILDELIGTRTFGNNSLAINHVLYLGSRSEVDDFMATTALARPDSGVRSPFEHLITLGVIGDSGGIRHGDSYQAAGEPLLAISSRLENVAAACSLADAGSKVVVIDGAKRITDLARFDSIAESQNLIIVAGADEEEKLSQIHDRGCRFWRFSLADLEIGGGHRQVSRFFHGVFRSARNQASFHAE